VDEGRPAFFTNSASFRATITLVILQRLPRPALRPFVKTLWASGEALSGTAVREHVLPTGTVHLAIRLSEAPLRLLDGVEDRVGRIVGHAVVGGMRSSFYVKDISSVTRAVGAELLPGAAEALLGAPAGELAERHTPLDDLWGGAAREARERLCGITSLEKQLDCFETLLAERLPRVLGLHPAVAQALERFASTASVGAVVRESGYSHRRFVDLFRRSVGLPPKLYTRILRFRHVLARVGSDDDASWADLAEQAGYSDQSHFNREFVEFTGVSPGTYRRIAPRSASHLPMA
jgi:AraC-like DNA-binding protein